MTPFLWFTAGPAGRITRTVAGLLVIAAGVLLGGGWWILTIVGLAPLGARLLDVCLLAPPLHRPFTGGRLRSGTAG